MLQQISWSAYFEFLFFLLFPYYAVIILIYYRKDLQWRFTNYQAHGNKTNPSDAVPVSTIQNNHNGNDNPLTATVHDLMDELGLLFRAARKQGFQKEELLIALDMQLRPYQKLKGSSVQSSIDVYITEQVKETCEIVIDEKEVAILWKEAPSNLPQ